MPPVCDLWISFPPHRPLSLAVPLPPTLDCAHQDALKLADTTEGTLGWLQRQLESHYRLPVDQQWLTAGTTQSLYDAQEWTALLASTTSSTCTSPLHLLLRVRGQGGKGGFGANLRALGNKLARRKITNFESCRDLSGRRLRTLTEAKTLAETKEKRDEWEREREERVDKKIAEGLKEAPEGAKKQRRFEDVQFLEEKEQMVDKVKEAVQQVLEQQDGVVVDGDSISEEEDTEEEEEESKKGASNGVNGMASYWNQDSLSEEEDEGNEGEKAVEPVPRNNKGAPSTSRKRKANAMSQ